LVVVAAAAAAVAALTDDARRATQKQAAPHLINGCGGDWLVKDASTIFSSAMAGAARNEALCNR